MYFVCTNTVNTIAGVGVGSPPNKTKNVEIFFVDLLRCIVDCIYHIHMYFVCMNTVKTL